MHVADGVVVNVLLLPHVYVSAAGFGSLGEYPEAHCSAQLWPTDRRWPEVQPLGPAGTRLGPTLIGGHSGIWAKGCIGSVWYQTLSTWILKFPNQCKNARTYAPIYRL
jgi:hypothetical protein